MSRENNNVKWFNFSATSGTYAIALVFDPASRTLFWSDALKQTIMKMHVLLNGSVEEPILVHDLSGKSPRTVTIDSCNRYVFENSKNLRLYTFLILNFY